MDRMISKLRAKKARSRHKQAGKTASIKVPLAQHSVMGFLIGLLSWLLTLAILNIEVLIQPQDQLSFVMSSMGEAAFLLVGLFAICMLLKIIKPETLTNNSQILLLSLCSLIPLIAAKGLVYLADITDINYLDQTITFLLPFAMAPLLATILIDCYAGLAAGLWTGLAMAILSGWSLPVLITGLIASVVTSQLARNVRKRPALVRIGLIAGTAEITCVFGMTAINWENIEIMNVIRLATACLLSGVLCSIIILIILPVFEFLFKITSNITLLDLSDLGHPLLQRLAIEAPGTYHHSLVVANLAQAAAEEIGANSLITRVAAYFHDIGKLTKPDFFAENIQRRDNPHDDLPPSMSTLVITSHVKEGLSLGLLHKLPKSVMDVIREHHGTSILSYFHHKANTQMDLELGRLDGQQNTKVDETNFRYSGPKPGTRESAIVCIADSVEAASRTIEKTTPTHIEGLVDDIVNARFLDGQLDNCDLKFTELTRIKRSFIFTLTNMLHGRVPYPKDENKDKQSAEVIPDESGKNEKAGTTSNGQGTKAES